MDYRVSGFQLYTLIVRTAPVPDREGMANAASKIAGVVEVGAVMAGEENVLGSAVGRDGDDLGRIGRDPTEIGLPVADEPIIRRHEMQPRHGFDES